MTKPVLRYTLLVSPLYRVVPSLSFQLFFQSYCLFPFVSSSVIHCHLSSIFPSPEELKRQAATLEGTQAQLSSVQAQLDQAQSEMETIQAVATVSENTKQEAIDQVRSQWQEEVASLQVIMKGKDDLYCKPNCSRHKIYLVV